jgi:hypothetical protein
MGNGMMCRGVNDGRCDRFITDLSLTVAYDDDGKRKVKPLAPTPYKTSLNHSQRQKSPCNAAFNWCDRLFGSRVKTQIDHWRRAYFQSKILSGVARAADCLTEGKGELSPDRFAAPCVESFDCIQNSRVNATLRNCNRVPL